MPKFERVLSMLGTDYLALGEAGDGPYVAAIRAAAAVFSARVPRADLAEYQIKVCREGEQIHVIFLDKERPPGMRGSGGRRTRRSWSCRAVRASAPARSR